MLRAMDITLSGLLPLLLRIVVRGGLAGGAASSGCSSRELAAAPCPACTGGATLWPRSHAAKRRSLQSE
eukprot:7778903-Alexandrium_andersonii.AAC.1